MIGREQQRVLATLAATAVLLVATVLGAAPAQADPGLEVSATSRYAVDLEQESVAGSMTITLSNTAPDEETPDGVRYYFFDAYAVPLPTAAAEVRAVSNGAILRVRPRAIEDESGYQAFEIQFPQLRYEQTRTIELTFTLLGQPARADDPTRIGPTHATFPVFGPGDPGRNTVEVVVPSGSEVDSTVASFERQGAPAQGEDGDTETYTSTEDNLGPGLSATMAVTAPGSAEGLDVTVGGVPLTLRPYPNDPEWADFVETWSDQGLPALVELLGQEWPGEIDAIREDSGSRVRGFDGWYSRSEREIVLGEALDSGLLFHELSHAWLNSATIEDRWLYEGLAELAAEHTAARTGGSFTTPRPVDRDDERSVPLATWETSPGFRGTETDLWAYPASYAVVTDLLSGLDPDGLQGILRDAVVAQSPWDLEGQRSLSGGPLTTRAFLDLLDEHDAPSVADGSAVELYRTWVLGEDEAALLERRGEAVAAYDAFVSSGPWGAPLGLRRAMATWDYDLAIEITRDRTSLPERARHLVDLADEAQVVLDPQVQAEYEEAGRPQDYEAVAGTLETVAHAIEEYAHARRAAQADRGPVAGLGARVLRVEESVAAARERLDAGAYEASVSASRVTMDRADQAGAVGAMIVAATVLALLLLLAVILLVRRARRRRSYRPTHVAPS